MKYRYKVEVSSRFGGYGMENLMGYCKICGTKIYQQNGVPTGVLCSHVDQLLSFIEFRDSDFGKAILRGDKI